MTQNSTFRFTQKSTTCFVHCGDEYLFIHRTKKGNDSDAGKLNGIGGKLEVGENFLDSAIREIEEETGYIVQSGECKLAGVVNMTEGYKDDWVMCFFTVEVPSTEIPKGSENDEGQLLWLHKDNVLTANYQLVDDLHYCWNDICKENNIFFAGAVVSEEEKIITWNSTFL